LTDTAAEVEDAPVLSVARAVRLYEPAGTFDHANANGAVVSVPISVVPEKNWTLVMVPSLSDAVAARSTVAGAVKLAPFAGAVSETTGGVLVGVVPPPETDTLERVAVAVCEVVWLETARPA
jgi:hypothetical protein